MSAPSSYDIRGWVQRNAFFLLYKNSLKIKASFRKKTPTIKHCISQTILWKANTHQKKMTLFHSETILVQVINCSCLMPYTMLSIFPTRLCSCESGQNHISCWTEKIETELCSFTSLDNVQYSNESIDKRTFLSAWVCRKEKRKWQSIIFYIYN